MEIYGNPTGSHRRSRRPPAPRWLPSCLLPRVGGETSGNQHQGLHLSLHRPCAASCLAETQLILPFYLSFVRNEFPPPSPSTTAKLFNCHVDEWNGIQPSRDILSNPAGMFSLLFFVRYTSHNFVNQD
jgi:hypothetical protein